MFKKQLESIWKQSQKYAKKIQNMYKHAKNNAKFLYSIIQFTKQLCHVFSGDIDNSLSSCTCTSSTKTPNLTSDYIWLTFPSNFWYKYYRKKRNEIFSLRRHSAFPTRSFSRYKKRKRGTNAPSQRSWWTGPYDVRSSATLEKMHVSKKGLTPKKPYFEKPLKIWWFPVNSAK